MTDTPPHTRLILVSEDLLERFGTRTDRGESITAEWGDPTPEGWYEPTFSVHTDDNLVVKERARIRAAVLGLMEHEFTDPYEDGATWIAVDRADVLAIIRR